MFRQTPPGADLIVVEDIPADPLAERPQRQAIQQIKLPYQDEQVLKLALLHPCVFCLIAQATFIALFCCHLLAGFQCV